MPLSLRRHWRLVAASVAVAVTLLVAFGHRRVTAVTGASTTEWRPGYDLSNEVALLDDTIVHTIDITVGPGEYEAMALAFETDGAKQWMRAAVTIDGVVVPDVGVRLKGNSTVFALSSPDLPRPMGPGPGGAVEPRLSFHQPEGLPWLISFDEYVPERTYQGMREVAVRVGGGITPITDLADALGGLLVAAAGAPMVDGAYAMVTFDDSEPALHFVVETPREQYAAEHFDHPGVLYKALSTGAWDYLGEDPTRYGDSFDQVTDVNHSDMAPVIRLLAFLDEASDDEFDAGLADHVEVEALARYLAVHDLIMDFDDLAGPGNNAYLWYDRETGRFTVLTWDLNLAFSGSPTWDPTAAALPGGGAGFVPPGGLAPGEGIVPPRGGDVIRPDPEGARPGPRGRYGARSGNPLEKRFLDGEAFAGLYRAVYRDAYRAVYGDGVADAQLDRLAGLLAEANARFEFAPQDLIDAEVAALRDRFTRRAAWLAEQPFPGT